MDDAAVRTGIPAPRKQVILELSPAEARALWVSLDNTLAWLRAVTIGDVKEGVSPDQWPVEYTRLLRVQRLVADGLNYLRQQPSEAAIRTGIPDPPARAE